MNMRVSVKIDGDASGAVQATQLTRNELNQLKGAFVEAGSVADKVNRTLMIRDDFGTASRKADIEAYAAQLDTLRGKYNPLFAAQQTYKQNLLDIRQAHKLGAISSQEMAAAIATQKTAFAGQVRAINGATGAVKLNQQQLMNMQFQLNDMAVMAASGQNPFVMIMQQGMQIGQMFGPGSTVMGALKATGAGFLTFLTNPIMLTVGATALLAGGIQMMFDAFSGPEALSAEEVIERLEKRINDLGPGWEDAEEAAKKYFKEVTKSASEAQAGITRSVEELKVLREQEIEKMYLKFAGSQKLRFMDISGDLKDVRALIKQLEAGTLSAQDFSQKIAQIRLSPETHADVRDLADQLLDLSPVDIDIRLNGAEAALATIEGIKGRIQQAFTAGLRDRFADNDTDSLQARLKAQAEEILNAGKAGERAAAKAAREAERARQEAERQALQRQNNALLLGDLEKEIAALQATGAEREFLLSQLKDEQQVRAAIASLGEEGTAAEVARLQQLIPLKNQLIEQSRQQEEQMRREEQSARGLASGLTGVIRQLQSGADAWEIFSDRLLNFGFNLVESGLMALLGGGASAFGGGAGGLLSMLFSAKGNAFSGGNVMAFANGGAFTNSVVSRPTMFNLGMMGEAGPEAIMPLQRGSDGRLGVAMHGGGAGAMEIRLGPDLEGRILSQAHNNSVKVVRSAAPSIAGQGANQGVALSRDSFSRQPWDRR